MSQTTHPVMIKAKAIARKRSGCLFICKRRKPGPFGFAPLWIETANGAGATVQRLKPAISDWSDRFRSIGGPVRWKLMPGPAPGERPRLLQHRLSIPSRSLAGSSGRHHVTRWSDTVQSGRKRLFWGRLGLIRRTSGPTPDQGRGGAGVEPDRHLLAIVSADVAGYSRLMSEDV